MLDILFPNHNEDALISAAKLFGIDKLLFVYDSPDKFYACKSVVKCINALVAVPAAVERARAKAQVVLVQSSDKDLSMIEQFAPSILFNLEASFRTDALHQRASGLNHILARACAKNNVTIAFSFRSLFKAVPERRAVLIGRMMQNIRLCRKFKVVMKIASFAQTPDEMHNPADLASLFVVLGMHPDEVQKALE